MDKAKIFMNGKSQAVRLPKKYRFSTEEILIEEHPRGVLLVDPKKRWEGLQEIIDQFSDDLFKDGRDQGKWEKRDEIE